MSTENTILLRGADAARARPVDLVKARLQAAASSIELDSNPAEPSGYASGWEEGLSLGRAEAERESERHRAELSALVDRLLAQIEQQSTETGHRLATETSQLALEIARAVVGRELLLADDPGGDAIARCLALAPDTGDVVARLHPDDAARLADVPALHQRELTVVTDDSLEPGDAIVTVDETIIEARVAEALHRVAEVLR